LGPHCSELLGGHGLQFESNGSLERDAGSSEQVARRHANVAWYRRNRGAVNAATRAALNGG
jgi:hypothetical protein